MPCSSNRKTAFANTARQSAASKCRRRAISEDEVRHAVAKTVFRRLTSLPPVPTRSRHPQQFTLPTKTDLLVSRLHQSTLPLSRGRQPFFLATPVPSEVFQSAGKVPLPAAGSHRHGSTRSARRSPPNLPSTASSTWRSASDRHRTPTPTHSSSSLRETQPMPPSL